MRKAARMKHEATRARSRLDELMFGAFNVHPIAVNGVFFAALASRSTFEQ